MKKGKKIAPIILLFAGIFLCLGPVWGLIYTTFGITNAFGVLGAPGATVESELLSNMELALWTTFAGLAMPPVGIAVLLLAIIWLARVIREERQSYDHASASS